MTQRRARRAPIGLWGLLSLIFLTVSGGPYGLEPAVGAVGGRGAVMLLVAVPLLWSLPVALMVGELAATLPLLGGYYRWVRETMGDFWGFQEGWWSWIFTWVDMPLYPALAGEILRQSWPLLTGHTLGNTAVLATVLGFIWVAALLNWLGAGVVAGYAVICSAGVIAPFAWMVAGAWRQAPGAAAAAAPAAGAAAWGLALTTVMWNYSGWDNVATFAPLVNEPRKTYPRALLLALGGIVAIYVLPVLAGLRVDAARADWANASFIQLGARAGGPALGLVMALTALAGAWAQYTGQLLYVLPLPETMAQDGFLPKQLGKTNARGVPATALWLCTILYSAFAFAGFERLLVADVLLYSAALALEFVALLRLRRRRPAPETPFRAPVEGWRLTLLCAVPLAFAAIMLGFAAAEDRWFTLLALGLLGTGPLLYRFVPHARATAVR